jgi:hypothetical protein
MRYDEPRLVWTTDHHTLVNAGKRLVRERCVGGPWCVCLLLQDLVQSCLCVCLLLQDLAQSCLCVYYYLVQSCLHGACLFAWGVGTRIVFF